MMYIESAIVIIAGDTVAACVKAAFYAAIILGSLSAVIKHIKAQDVILMLTFIIAIAFSYITMPSNRDNIQNLWLNAVAVVVPCFFLGLAFDGDEKTMNMLRYASIAAVMASWAYIIYLSIGNRILFEYYLVYSYALLPHTLLLLLYAFGKPSPGNIVFAILGAMYQLSMGARGPVVAVLVFVVIFLWQKSRSVSKKALFLIIAASIAFLVFYSELWVSLLVQLKSFVGGTLGLSTRVFDAILAEAGEASNDARMRIYTYIWQLIKQQPLTGYGVFGDWQFINYSSHQIFLELWMHYGIVIGTVVAGFLGYVFIKPYRRIKDDLVMGFYLVLVALNIPSLIYRGSYINAQVFFMIGFCLNQLRIAKRNQGYLDDRRKSSTGRTI